MGSGILIPRYSGCRGTVKGSGAQRVCSLFESRWGNCRLFQKGVLSHTLEDHSDMSGRGEKRIWGEISQLGFLLLQMRERIYTLP